MLLAYEIEVSAGAITGIVTCLCGAVGWLLNQSIKIGKCLQLLENLNANVATLQSAFDSQEKKLSLLDREVALLIQRESDRKEMAANDSGRLCPKPA